MTTQDEIINSFNHHKDEAIKQWDQNKNINTKFTYIDNFLPESFVNKLYLRIK